MKKVKLVEVTEVILESQADCLKALLDGYVLLDHFVGNSYKLIDGKVLDLVSRKPANTTFGLPQQYKVFKEEEAKWYDELPEVKSELPLVICWVGNYPDFEKDYVQGIYGKSYNEKGEIRFDSFGTTWAYAIPVTREELENINGNYLK